VVLKALGKKNLLKHTWSTQDNKKVHAIDTNAWIVSDSQIDVFLNAKTKVTG
jgi:hypothetical protein